MSQHNTKTLEPDEWLVIDGHVMVRAQKHGRRIRYVTARRDGLPVLTKAKDGEENTCNLRREGGN